MERGIGRRFSLVDAMALIAATAVGFGAIRGLSPEFYTYGFSPIPPPTWAQWWLVVLASWAFYVMPLPAAWTIAAVGLRFLGPRPGGRRLSARPGMTATVAASVAVAAGLAYYLIDLGNPSWHDRPFESTTYAAGVAVGAAWTVQAIGRRWRAERSWIDRLGRSLGVYWLLMIPILFGRTFAGF